MKSKCNRFLVLLQGQEGESVFITLVHEKTLHPTI
jgi:hypothetical protein